MSQAPVHDAEGQRKRKMEEEGQHQTTAEEHESDNEGDRTLWKQYTMHLPSDEEMEHYLTQLRRLNADRSRQRNLKEPSLPLCLDLRSLFCRDDVWFQTLTCRCFYEIILASYLPHLTRNGRIDFKVVLDDGIPGVVTPVSTETDQQQQLFQCPAALDAYIHGWVESYLLQDNVFCASNQEGPTGKAMVVRRAWALSFKTDFVNQTFNPNAPLDEVGNAPIQVIGHQMLVVAEKRRNEDPRHVKVLIVDNVPPDGYQYPFHAWISASIRQNFKRLLPQLTITKMSVAMNKLPMSNHMGTCMSCSFRAILIFSFLQNPFPYLFKKRKDNMEAIRFMKLLYVQLQRMRLYFLYNNTASNESGEEIRMEPVYVPMRITRATDTMILREVSTPYLWMVNTPKLLESAAHHGAASLSIEAWLRQCAEVDREDLIYSYRLYFHRDLSAPNAFQRVDLSTPCIVQARFPASFLGFSSDC